MLYDHNRLNEKLSKKSLAKWKRDAEAWHKQDSAMFEGLIHMVEANVVRLCLRYLCKIITHTVLSA
jgi:hypothetical protein